MCQNLAHVAQTISFTLIKNMTTNGTVILPGRPAKTRWWYFPGPPISSWEFVQKAGAIGVRTPNGYFFKFRTKVPCHIMTMRVLCPVPLTRSRFRKLSRRAIERDNEKDADYTDSTFCPLKIRDTLHYRNMQALGAHI